MERCVVKPHSKYLPVTDEVVANVLTMREFGVTDTQAARDLGVCPSALSREMSRRGLGHHQIERVRPVEEATPAPAPKLPKVVEPKAPRMKGRARVLRLEDEHLDQIRRLARWKTVDAIAKRLSISNEDVRLVMNRNGIEAFKRGLRAAS